MSEFLPISSSGHLVIAQRLFGLTADFVLVNVVLHAGSLSALLIFFYPDIRRILKGLFSRQALELKTGLYILIVTAVTAVIVYPARPFFKGLFGSVSIAATGLAITGAVLLLSSRFSQGKRSMAQLNPADASLIGLAQAVSVIPGLSRSGLTISAGLFKGVQREAAFKFSFLASIPAVLGALMLTLSEGVVSFSGQLSHLALGFLAAFLSGLLALKILKNALLKAKFAYFGYYCLIVSALAWVWLKI